MHKWFLLLSTLALTTARAQYYYTDILSSRTTHDNYLLQKKAVVRSVTITSTDPDGSPTEGFSVTQQVNTGRNTVETISRSAYSNPSVLTSVYQAEGWPLSATDSTNASVARVAYAYTTGPQPQLCSVTAATVFPGEKTNAYLETRSFQYAGDQLKGMVRIKNGKDTLQVRFIPEEHGWIGEERWTQKGRTIEIYYYYYDADGRVTDIAQYNKAAKRILPVYTFEYDAQGRVASMMTVLAGSTQYRTWRYTYDNRGLKIGEVVYNKFRKEEGRLTYSYQ